MNILVVGGNGGIGAALVRKLVERDDGASVTATWCHHLPRWQHPRVNWARLDPSDEEAIAALASTFEHLDWLINAVGMLHEADDSSGPERTIRRFDGDFFLRSVAINTLPTLLLAKHFHRPLNHDRRAHFAALSARVGSIEENRLGGWYSYRSSKAALNMALVTLAIEWQRLVPNACVSALHPGTVDTALSVPFQRGVPAHKLFTAERSAAQILANLDRLEPTDSGRFWSWDGSELPW